VFGPIKLKKKKKKKKSFGRSKVKTIEN